jgi:putative sterol carrier protein
MPPYLSPAWVQAFNVALANLDLTDAIAAAGRGSTTAAQGTFRVAQVILDGPEGEVRTVLTVDQGRITLETDPAGALAANVTIVVAFDDAAAIARGELDPADALSAGRVRVRGELAVLVAGQAVLNVAAAKLGRSLTDLGG